MAGRSASLATQYDRMRSRLEQLKEEIQFILSDALTAANLATHSVTFRVKNRGSFLAKVERLGYEDPLMEMTDLVGARLVCLFLSDLAKLEDIVRANFEVLEVRDHIAGSSVDTFGYMSRHFICRLQQSHAGPRYDAIKSLAFEVQCRTLLMDAWANVSHVLAYKNEESVPTHLRRDFHALAGLFYVADRHFQMFFESSVQSDREAERAVKADLASSTQVALDAGTVLALLEELYPDRPASRSDASELLPEILRLGYRSIRPLREALENSRDLALAYEAEAPQDVRFAAIGMARNSLGIVHPEYKSLVDTGKRRRRVRNPRHDEYHQLYLRRIASS